MSIKLTNKLYAGKSKISIPAYDNLPALRSTLLKKFMISPAHYLEEINSPDESDKAHFIIGSYIHGIILEPELIGEQFAVLDVSGRNTKIYKEAKESLKGTGKQIILQSEMEMCNQMKERAMKDKAFTELVDASEREISAVAQLDGVWCKARFDGLIHPTKDGEGWILYDIKSTSDSAYWFPHNIQKYGYDVSCAFYIDILETATGKSVEQFTFAVIEKPSGFVKLFDMTEEYVQFGRNKYRPALAQYLECLRINEWPSYDNTKERRLLPPI